MINKAEVTEVFSSFQGEGIFYGAKQIFVRFLRCNMRCAFCDESMKRSAKLYSPLELMAEVKMLEVAKGQHHSASLTGGEPLLYVDFLREFLPMLRKAGIKSYLETNGTLPGELEKIIDMVDIIAMDFKLPSSTGGRAYWDEHRKFLETGLRKKIFAKAVITPATTRDDIDTAAKLVKVVNSRLPFILQVATPLDKNEKRIDNEKVFDLLNVASKNDLENTRAMGQFHKIWNIR